MADGNPIVRDPDRLDWRGRAAGYLIGVASGVGVNLLSNLGLRAFAVVAVGAALLVITSWLRRLSPLAPLARYSVPAFLFMAGAGAVLVLVLPGPWAGVMTLVAVGFLAGAVLLAATLAAAVRLLVAATSVGLAVALIAAGSTTLEANWRAAVTSGLVVVFGIILILAGYEALRGEREMRGTDIIGVGVVGMGGAAIAFFQSADLLLPAVVMTNGAVLLLSGNHELDNRVQSFLWGSFTYRELIGLTWCSLALVSTGWGIVTLLHSYQVSGLAAICAGVAGGFAGAAILHRANSTMGVAAVVLGASSICGGFFVIFGHVDIQRSVGLVLGVAVTCAGLTAVVGGLTLLSKTGHLRRVASLWRYLTEGSSRG